jgi:oligopeptide transport system permease protein
MKSQTKTEHTNDVATLSEHTYGKSLLRDSFERLSRNRVAMIGLVVILLNIFIAIFADVIAPRGFADQVRENYNAAPVWVIKLFPLLSARDETWEVGGGTALVESGQQVKTGDLLISYSDQELNAEEEGRVFVDDRRINLFPPDADIPQFTIPAETILAVGEGARVNPGDLLFADTPATIQGIVLQVADTVWLMPRTSWRSDLGEVLVETGQAITAGDPIIRTDSGDVLAPIGGTIFVSRTSVDIWVLPVERLSIPEGAEVLIRATRSSVAVAAGDLLFNDVTAPISGVAFQLENELFIFRDQSWEYGIGTPVVTSGEIVPAGQKMLDFTPLNAYANMDGYIVLHEGQVILSPLEPSIYTMPQDTTPSVVSGQRVEIGQALFGSTTAAAVGTAYVSDNTIAILPANNGYTTQRNEYPLGADSLGRDILSRIIYGARISLAVAFVGPVVATLIGVSIGLISGYKSGWIDNLIMRVVDVFYAFPTLLLIILMMAYFRSGAFSTPEAEGTFGHYMYIADQSMGGMLFIFIGIGLTSWLGLARLTRGQVLSTRENEYIVAARAMGASQFQIIFKHILPNVLGPLIVAETLTIPSYISYEAFLSFIGLGVNPPTPSWGSMISTGSITISSYPFQAIFPALALFFIMFAFNFLGDGLRDAFDPRMRGTD